MKSYTKHSSKQQPAASQPAKQSCKQASVTTANTQQAATRQPSCRQAVMQAKQAGKQASRQAGELCFSPGTKRRCFAPRSNGLQATAATAPKICFVASNAPALLCPGNAN